MSYPLLPMVVLAESLCRFWVNRDWEDASIDEGRDTVVWHKLASFEVVYFWAWGLHLGLLEL